MRPKTSALFAAVVLLFSPLPLFAGASADQARSVESATWRFEFDNDLFFHKDNKLTNVWAIHRYSAVAGSWDGEKGTPGFIRNILKAVPGLEGEALSCRSGLGISQIMQTPTDSTRTDLIVNDVPYAGAITAHGSWFAFNDEDFCGIELICGLLGPYSFAEQTQKAAHRVFDSVDPKGWDNQLKTEPLLNLNYTIKRKVLKIGKPEGLSMDTALGATVGIGNLFTHASASIDIRVGGNLPRGFFYVPNPAGVFMNYMASLRPADADSGSVYAGLSLRATAFAWNTLLDGNMFRESHSVDKKPFVGSIAWGLYYEGESLGITLAAIASTEDVDTSKATAAEGKERLGIISVEWRF